MPEEEGAARVAAATARAPVDRPDACPDGKTCSIWAWSNRKGDVIVGRAALPVGEHHIRLVSPAPSAFAWTATGYWIDVSGST